MPAGGALFLQEAWVVLSYSTSPGRTHETRIAAPLSGPYFSHCLGEAAAAIADNHDRGGNGIEKDAPRSRCLRTRQVPRQNVFVAAGDEDNEVARKMDTVDIDDAMHLPSRLRHRPYEPKLARPPLKGSPLPRHVALGALGEKPSEESLR